MSETGVVLDSGVFIALERRDEKMTRLALQFAKARVPLVTSAGVVAQIWRGGGHRQVPIAFLLARTEVVDLSARVARTLGLMLATAGVADPIDAHVVLLARERGWPVVTSDPSDLRAIDPTIALERI